MCEVSDQGYQREAAQSGRRRQTQKKETKPESPIVAKDDFFKDLMLI